MTICFSNQDIFDLQSQFAGFYRSCPQSKVLFCYFVVPDEQKHCDINEVVVKTYQSN
jgi:hypothetical protein